MNPFRIRMLAAALPLGLLILSSGLAQAQDRFSLELEAGPVWQTVNDQEIPNDGTATRFSLVDLAGKGPQFAARGYLTWRINEKHSLRGLFAPLSFTETGTPTGDISFNGDSFSGNTPTEATYTFNSYRLTYRYRWLEGENWHWHIGFTAKIRDAQVQLVQGDLTSTKDNTGFVPLLHLAGRYQINNSWYVNLDIDALAGGPGRAEDAALKLGRQLGSSLAWELGYRTVEGGADVDDVYSFAWLHYAVTSVRWDF